MNPTSIVRPARLVSLRTRLAFLIAMLSAPVASFAQTGDASSSTTPRRNSFTPDRPERCEWFMVTDFEAGPARLDAGRGADDWVFSDGLGVMRNFGNRHALGASIDLYVSSGGRLVPTLRYKRWLAGRQSLDASLGYAPKGKFDEEGVVGPIAEVGYSPNQWIHFQAGACRIHEVNNITNYPTWHADEKSPVRLHVGVGLSGVAGLASWAAQLVGLAGVAASFN